MFELAQRLQSGPASALRPKRQPQHALNLVLSGGGHRPHGHIGENGLQCHRLAHEHVFSLSQIVIGKTQMLSFELRHEGEEIEFVPTVECIYDRCRRKLRRHDGFGEVIVFSLNFGI